MMFDEHSENTFRSIVMAAYVNSLEVNKVPTIAYISHEDTECAVELYYETVNLLTFGSVLCEEDMDEEDILNLESNEYAYVDAFKGDIESLLKFENMVFIDLNDQLTNAPIIKVW